MKMFNVNLMTKVNGNTVSKPVFTNMSEADAIKVSQRMNRLNILAAKVTGKVFVYVFKVVKNG